MTIFESIPTCFYHPIKVIFLDDNRAFLDTLELEFNDCINMQTFTNPDAVLCMLNHHREDINKSILTLVNNLDVDTTTDRVVGFEINKILDIIYDKTRFNNTAILVVDYEMPNINGVDFCLKLKGKNIFKIMLTAEADKDTAIKAFNNGAIDKFLLKTNENLYRELAAAIVELTHNYFKKSSQTIIHGYNNSINSLFNNEAYQQLFKKIWLDTQAVEYYMVDNSGSFLFLDKNAVPTWLILRHVKDLHEQLELFQGYDVEDEILLSLSKNEKMLFLPSEKEYKKPVNEWINYLFEAKQLDDNYYYSVVNSRITDSIKWDKVVPYAATLELAEVINS